MDNSSRMLACLAFTKAREGGFSDNPDDRGGATMEGVTIATFRAWLNDTSATVEQLKAISAQEWNAIMINNYFHPPQCQALPPGLDLMVFDMAVNAGVRASAKLLQSAVHVTADGWVGPATLAAVAAAPAGLIDRLADAQSAYYRACSTFPTFGTAWLNRVALRHTTALIMAGGTPQQLHARPGPPPMKAQPHPAPALAAVKAILSPAQSTAAHPIKLPTSTGA